MFRRWSLLPEKIYVFIIASDRWRRQRGMYSANMLRSCKLALEKATIIETWNSEYWIIRFSVLQFFFYNRIKIGRLNYNTGKYSNVQIQVTDNYYTDFSLFCEIPMKMEKESRIPSETSEANFLFFLLPFFLFFSMIRYSECECVRMIRSDDSDSLLSQLPPSTSLPSSVLPSFLQFLQRRSLTYFSEGITKSLRIPLQNSRSERNKAPTTHFITTISN